MVNILRIILLGGLLFGTGIEMTLAQDAGKKAQDTFLLLRAKLPGLQTHELFVWKLDFAPGASVGEHAHPSQEILLVTEGLLSVDINGEKSVVAPGEILLIPAGSKMAVQNLKMDATSQALQVIVANRGEHPKKMVSE